MVQALGLVFIGLGLATVFAAAVVGRDGLILDSYDPQMVYFFDSLAPFRGHLYAFVDHPGTPVEVIGTLLLALTALFLLRAPHELVAYHIAHPQVFLVLAWAFLTAGSVATVILIVRTFSRDVEEEPAATLLPLALAVVHFALFQRFTFLSLVFWSHNSFSFLGGASLLAALFLSARSDGALARRRLLVVGALAGVLTAVQLYFAAWVVGVAVVTATLARLEGQKLRAVLGEAARVGLASIGGFLLATFPILPRYPTFARWVLSLLTHAQHYGQGEEVVVSPEVVAEGVSQFWRLEPSSVTVVLGSGALLCAVMLARSRRGAPRHWWALGFGVLAVLATLVLLILKHPSPRYLPSVAALVPFLLGLALPSVARQGRWGRWVVSAAAVAILVAYFGGVGRARGRLDRMSARSLDASAQVQSLLVEYARALGRPRHDLRVLWAHGTPSTCFGYRMGAAFHEAEVFDADVDRLCPNEWNFDAGRRENPLDERVREGTVGWDVIVARPGTNRLPTPSSLGEVVPVQAGAAPRFLVIFRDRDRAPRP